MSDAVCDAAERFVPTLVTTLAILDNGAARDDLVRLGHDLEGFADDLLDAAEAEGADLPAPLVDALADAIETVGDALSPPVV